MTDDELNKNLAEIFNIKPYKDFAWDTFDYKDPAIRCKCEDWLLDNGAIIGTDSDDKYFVDHSTFSGQRETLDKDIYKAVALARIEASKP